MILGQEIFYNDGELAFENVINTKKDVGTHKAIFLEEFPGYDADHSWIKLINVSGRIQVVPKALVSMFNI